MAILKALLIGKVKTYGDKEATDPLHKIWQTAMFKQATIDEIWTDKLGFRGDFVADSKHHGGEEKAVFANSYENYPVWSEFLGLKNLPFGAMGENLTISGMHEDDVCTGDIHQIGSLVLQVSQPRKPCFKLSKRWMNKNLTNEIFRSGLSGWYYRVLKEGSCKAGDEVKLVQKGDTMSIRQINRLFFAPLDNLNLLDEFMALKFVDNRLKDDVKRRVKGSYDTSYMREI